MTSDFVNISLKPKTYVGGVVKRKRESHEVQQKSPLNHDIAR